MASSSLHRPGSRSITRSTSSGGISIRGRSLRTNMSNARRGSGFPKFERCPVVTYQNKPDSNTKQTGPSTFDSYSTSPAFSSKFTISAESETHISGLSSSSSAPSIDPTTHSAPITIDLLEDEDFPRYSTSPILVPTNKMSSHQATNLAGDKSSDEQRLKFRPSGTFCHSKSPSEENFSDDMDSGSYTNAKPALEEIEATRQERSDRDEELVNTASLALDGGQNFPEDILYLLKSTASSISVATAADSMDASIEDAQIAIQDVLRTLDLQLADVRRLVTADVGDGNQRSEDFDAFEAVCPRAELSGGKVAEDLPSASEARSPSPDLQTPSDTLSEEDERKGLNGSVYRSLTTEITSTSRLPTNHLITSGSDASEIETPPSAHSARHVYSSSTDHTDDLAKASWKDGFASIGLDGRTGYVPPHLRRKPATTPYRKGENIISDTSSGQSSSVLDGKDGISSIASPVGMSPGVIQPQARKWKTFNNAEISKATGSTDSCNVTDDQIEYEEVPVDIAVRLNSKPESEEVAGKPTSDRDIILNEGHLNEERINSQPSQFNYAQRQVDPKLVQSSSPDSEDASSSRSTSPNLADAASPSATFGAKNWIKVAASPIPWGGSLIKKQATREGQYRSSTRMTMQSGNNRPRRNWKTFQSHTEASSVVPHKSTFDTWEGDAAGARSERVLEEARRIRNVSASNAEGAAWGVPDHLIYTDPVFEPQHAQLRHITSGSGTSGSPTGPAKSLDMTTQSQNDLDLFEQYLEEAPHASLVSNNLALFDSYLEEDD